MYIQVYQSVDSKFKTPVKLVETSPLPSPSASVRSSVYSALRARLADQSELRSPGISQIDRLANSGASDARAVGKWFRGWREGVRKFRELWKSGVVLRAQQRARRARVSVEIWKTIYDERKNLEIFYDSILVDQQKLREFRLRRKFLRSWREEISDSKIATTLYLLVLARRKHKFFARLKNCFFARKVERQQTEMAEIFHEEKRKSLFFGFWRDFRAWKLSLEICSRNFRLNLAFSKFLTVGARLVEDRKFLESFARPIIRSWREISDHAKLIEGLLARCALGRAKRLLRASLAAAKEVARKFLVARNFRQRSLFQVAISGLTAASQEISVRVGFFLWRWGARKVREDRNRTLLIGNFSAWRRATKISLENDDRRRLLRLRVFARRKKTHFRTWKILTSNCLLAASHHRNSTALSALRNWRSFARQEIRFFRISRFLQKRMHAQAISEAFQRLLRLKLAADFRAESEISSFFRMFRTWREVTIREKDIRRRCVDRKSRESEILSEKVISILRRNVQDRQAGRTRGYFRMLEFSSRRYFRLWRVAIPMLRAERKREVLADEGRNFRLLRKALGGFSWYVARQRWKDRKLLAEKTHVMRCKVLQALRNLRSNAEISLARKTRVTELRAALEFKTREIFWGKFFRLWRGPVMQRKFERKQRQRQSEIFRKISAFERFRKESLKLREKNERMRMIGNFWGKNLIAKFIKLWRLGAAENFRQKISVHRALRFRAGSLMGKAWDGLMEYLGILRRAKYLGDRKFLAFKSSKLGPVFAALVQYARNRKEKRKCLEEAEICWRSVCRKALSRKFLETLVDRETPEISDPGRELRLALWVADRWKTFVYERKVGRAKLKQQPEISDLWERMLQIKAQVGRLSYQVAGG